MTSSRLRQPRAVSRRYKQTLIPRQRWLECLEPRILMTSDFGDAPDTGVVPGTGNYNTLFAHAGPSHIINSTQTTLFLGARVDGEADGIPNIQANGDDKTTLPDDEDGVIEPAQDLVLTTGTAPVVRVRATNTTGSVATLYAWIDINRDGMFDSATERTSVSVPNATNNGTFTLTFPTIPTSATTGLTYARFRLSSDVGAAVATGTASGGEVEDYAATISKGSDSTVNGTKSRIITSGASGGPALAPSDYFGTSVASLGDLDGDGITDLAVGAYRDDTGGFDRGAVYVQFMNSNGTVRNSVKLASGLNGTPTLADTDSFGTSVASLGDLDGDGVNDLAVGAFHDDTAGTDRGALYVLLMNTNGTVKSSLKIASGLNGCPTLANSDYFGASVISLGDLDGDGVIDLAVSTPADDSFGLNRGSVQILLLNSNGSVKGSQRIGNTFNGGPALNDFDFFGRSVASLGDLDGDGVTDLAVSAFADDTGGLGRGAVYILQLNANGTAKSSTKIASGMNGGPTLANSDYFGISMSSLADLDGDGVTDLAVGALRDDTGGADIGALHLLLLNSNGTVKSSKKLASGTNGAPTLAPADFFGSAVSSLGDLDGDGVTDLAVGAAGTDAYGISRGAVHVLFLNSATSFGTDFGDAPDIGSGTGTGNYQTLLANDGPRHSITATQTTLFLGARVDGEVNAIPNTRANGDDQSTVPDDEDGLLEPAQDLLLTVGTVSVVRMHATNTTGSTATLYGWIDVNRDGIFDNATERASATVPSGMINGTFTLTFPSIPTNTTAGATYARFRLSSDPAASNSTGAAVGGEVEDYPATISLPSDGTADSTKTKKLVNGTNGAPTIAPSDYFGRSVASLGDLDGDGINDVAVGAVGDDTGGPYRGAVHVLLLNANGTVKNTVKITSGMNGGPILADRDFFGSSIASLGDLDGDGIADLAVGATGDDTGGNYRGAVHILLMNANGTVKSSTKIASGINGAPTLVNNGNFGLSVALLDDLDGDGVVDLAVGASTDINDGQYRGVVHVLLLNSNGTVKGRTLISNGVNGAPILNTFDRFGQSITSLGDLDGDGVTDLAIGAEGDDLQGGNSGSVYVLLLNSNATIKGGTKIASNTNGGPVLGQDYYFGHSLTSLGDLDGDGVTDLAVGALLDDSAGADRGAVYVQFLNSNGTVKGSVKLASDTNGGPTLLGGDLFGSSVATLGDLNDDGTTELAVGAFNDDSGNFNSGAVYILFLKPTGFSTTDFGDAPDTGSGTGPGNYQTLLANGGPSHVITTTQSTLFLGSRVDAEANAAQNTRANGDDTTTLPDDEDGLFDPAQDLSVTVGTAAVVRVRATNTTGSAATLYGWIDINGDGVFDNSTERTSVTVPNGSSNSTFTLTFPVIPSNTTPGATYARFRLSSDVAAASSIGAAIGGEVEDYPVTLTQITDGTADNSLSKKFSGGLNGGPSLGSSDNFGSSLASLGDLDGDGVVDLAVGAYIDDTGGLDRGAVYVQFMNANGTVKNGVKIASGVNGGPALSNSDLFGASVTSLGDLDGDGITDLAVGTPLDDTNGTSRGAVQILFLNSNGTVKSNLKIASTTNGGPGLANYDFFGRSVTSLGDLDGDGVTDLAVGAFGDDFTGGDAGAVYVLFLNSNGTVRTGARIGNGTNGVPAIASSDFFGVSLAALGDLNGDGITDLAVGVQRDDTGGPERGAVDVLFLNANGTVQGSTKIASNINGCPTLADGDGFGISLSTLGDLDGDGVNDLATGAFLDDTGGFDRGALYVQFLNANGSVKSSVKMAHQLNGGPTLADGDIFGFAVTSLGDLNGDGVAELAVGAERDDTGNYNGGAVHVLFLKPTPVTSPIYTTDFGDAPDLGSGTGANDYQTILANGGPSHDISATQTTLFLGARVDGEADATQNTRANGDDKTTVPDDEDGLVEPAQDLLLTVGAAPIVRARATNTTGVPATLYGWIDINQDGVFDNATERTWVTVPSGTINGTFVLTFPTIPSNTAAGVTYARFRLSSDFAAADATGPALGGEVEDYAATISLRSDSTVDSTKSRKIANDTDGGPTLGDSDFFGISVASLGDLDGDGINDLATGAYRDDAFGVDRGALYVQFMNADGTVKNSVKIGSGTNGGPVLANGDLFGFSVASLGDLDGDGVSDLAVGAKGDDTGGSYSGALYVLLLNANGTVKSSTKIASGTNGGPTTTSLDFFGWSVTPLGDLNGDGVTDLAVGALGDDSGGSDRGSIHVLLMNSSGTVKSSVKIASGFNGAPTLNDGDFFGASVASLGDLDGDGITDLAVGATSDDTGGPTRGAVHVLLLNANGTVKSTSKIASALNGGPILADNDFFGFSVASIGDLDGDGVTDLAVGTPNDSTGGAFRGAVYLLQLNSNATVKSSQRIASGLNGGPTLSDADRFGISVAYLGDLDGNGVSVLAVGAYLDDTGGLDRGALHVLFLGAVESLDFGDAPTSAQSGFPASYPTSLADNGARHEPTGPRLGADRDAEADGQSTASTRQQLSPPVDGDAVDEDGVYFLASLVSTTTATTGYINVNLQNAADAKLDAWVDFNQDGDWSDPGEQIFVNQQIISGDQTLSFTVPANAATGVTFARFRVSTGGNLAPTGLAADGEVEDYPVNIIPLGSLDKTFDTDGIAVTQAVPVLSDNGNRMAIQADGKVVVVGSAYNGSALQFAVLRYNQDGSLDTTFDGDGKTFTSFASSNQDAQDVAIQSDGKIVVVGRAHNGSNYDFAIARYNPDGSLDTTFDGDGKQTLSFGSSTDVAYGMAIDSNNRIVVVGTTYNGSDSDFAVARLNSNGSLDGNFDGDGKISIPLGAGDDTGYAVAIQSTGEIVVVGDTSNGSNSDFGIIRLTDNGALDTSFDGDGKTTITFGSSLDQARDVALDANGKIVVVGATIASGFTFAVARFNSNGSLDASFDGDGRVTTAFGGNFSYAYGVAIQTNGRIVVAGYSSDFSFLDDTALARYNTNGSLDITFDGDGKVLTDVAMFWNEGARDVAIQPDGGIVVAGSAVSGNSDINVFVARYQGGPFTTDFGDAPDTGARTGTGNYETLAANGGPSHDISTTQTSLFLGAHVDSEVNATVNIQANGDDKTASPDDEDGLIEPAQDLVLTVDTAPAVRVRATNTTGAAATLYGWIDINQDGVFDNATERASVTVPSGTNNGTFTLTFPTIPTSATAGVTYARFRLSSDEAAANATGAAVGGEVEDYVATITERSGGDVDSTKTVKIASGTNGGPTLSNGDLFGQSMASLGDLDGDGVNDLAVGAFRDDAGGTDRGAVYVQFMNANGTMKSSVKIASGTNGGPTLVNFDGFGFSVASLGDLDGDGTIDLAVGAYSDDTNGTDRGAVHVLLLNANGTVKSSLKLASGTNGGPTLANSDNFGSSVASLGDLDGDGVTDLAVGAFLENTGGGDCGAVYVLLLNANGTVKDSLKIASGTNGGPTIANGAQFGSRIASLGDLDGDGVTDLAVGAYRDGTGGDERGAVHVLLLNANGTVKSSLKLASGTNGGPTLADVDRFGSSVASLGDLDGDGVTDLAVGASGDDTNGTNRGAVHVLLLNANGTVKRDVKLASGTNGGPTLADFDIFGASVASLGDLDGDGLTDLAVGTEGDDTGGNLRGAVHVLFLKALDVTPPTLDSFTRQIPSTSPTNADTLVFRVTFSETVVNVDTADFAVTGTTAGITGIFPVSGSNGTQYDIVVSGGDLAGFNGDVGLNLAGVPTVEDLTGNALQNAEPLTDETYLLDNIAPTTISFTRQSPLAEQTNADTLVFRVTFSEPVLGVDQLDFTVGGAPATTVTITAVSTSVYDVTVSGFALENINDTVGLFFGSTSIYDFSFNSLPSTAPPIDETYYVDNTAPRTNSITREGPPFPTNADTLVFRVTFNEGVTGVDATDFIASGTTAAVSVATVNATTYDVTLTGGDLANLTGNVGLDLASPTINDLAGNPLPNVEPTTDDTFEVDNTPPSAVSFVRQSPGTSLTNADTLVFRVTFSEAVVGVDAADFVASGTTATISVASVNTLVYDVTLTSGDLENLNGAVGLNFTSPTIADLAINFLPNAEPATDETYLIDNIAPTTTSFSRLIPVTSPTSADSLVFRVTFSDAVTGVDAADFVASGTTATISVASVTALVYDVTFTDGDLTDLNGLVGLDFASPTIEDLAGNVLPSVDPSIDETYLVDNTAPITISFVRQAPATSPTNVDTLVIRVTFNEAVTSVDAADFVASGTTASISVASVSALVYDVTLTGGDLADLNGMVGLEFVSPTINDLAGNALPNIEPTIDEAYLVDNIAPTTISFVRQVPATSPTNADTLVFRVTFSEAVTGVNAADFTATGTSADVSAAAVSALIYDVTLSGGDLAIVNGPVGLNLASPAISDLAGNSLPNIEPVTDETYDVNNISPELSSIELHVPSVNPTNADILVFRVTFTKSVAGVDAADFEVSGSSATVTDVSLVSSSNGTQFYVSVSGGDLAGLNGSVGLNLAAGQDIVDTIGNALLVAEPLLDETYLIDNTAPLTTSIVRQSPSVSLTNTDTLVFRVTLSEAVTGVDTGDFAVSGTTAALSVAPVSATVFDVTLTGGDLANVNGIVGLSVSSPTITDLAGNALPNIQPTTNETYLVDNIAPVTTSFVRQSPATSPTNANTLVVRVTFNEAVVGVDAADFEASGTTANLSVASVSPNVYDVTLTGGDLANLAGTVSLNFASPTISDLAGNALPNSEPATDDSYVLDNTAPVLTITPNGTLTNAATTTFTFQFSEIVTGFDVTDITVTNGAKGTFTAMDGDTFTLIVTPAADGTVSVSVGTNAASDAASNGNTAASATINSDRTAPTLIITPNGTLTNAASTTLTFQFSETVIGFNASDVTVTNGTKGLFTVVDNDTYTLVVSPISDGAVNVSVAANTAQDVAGNNNTLTTASVTSDRTAPSLAITPSSGTTKAGQITFTFQFSEVVTGFDASDIVVTNGTKGTFTAIDGDTYTLVVVPVTDGTVTVSVASNAAQDATGNNNSLTSAAVTSDRTVPSLTITPNSGLTNASQITWTFQFTEAVTGFNSNDVLVTNGTKGLFTAVDGDTYTLVVSPISDGTVIASVAASAAQDVAGNNNASTTASVTSDRTVPSLTITPNTGTANAGQITFTFQWSETVAGFDSSDILVTNGTKGVFTAIDGDTYTLVVTPLADGSVTASVAANAAQDAAGNNNAQTSAAVVSDRTAPLLTITPNTGTTNASQITFTFQWSENVTGFDASEIVVTNGTKGTFTAVDGDTYTLLVTPIADGPVSVSVNANAASDAASNGNLAATASIISDRTAPSLSITPIGTLSNAAAITFTFQFSEIVTGFDASDISVTNGTKEVFTAVDGDTYTLVVTPNTDGAVSVGVSVNAAFDVATNGNQAASATITSDRSGPVLSSSASPSILENSTTVLTVIATDAHGPVIFDIVAGSDASVFSINANSGALQFIIPPDFETPADTDADNVYSIQIKATDALGQTTIQDMAITVAPVNDNNPIFTSASNISVAENVIEVGQVSATDADLPAQLINYSISGGSDAGRFQISSTGELTFVTAPDFENPTDVGGDNTYHVTIAATDNGTPTQSTLQDLVILVTNIDETPSDIALSVTSVSEQQPIGTAIGNFTTTDPDAEDTFSYSLESGPGSTDNDKFTIVNGQLRTAADLDFETQPSYSILVRSTDQGELTFEKQFTIALINVNEPPAISSIADQSIPEDTASSLPFSIGDPESSAGSLILNATSSNPGLIPNANLVISGTGADRHLAITPISNQNGSATITITVGDGTLSSSQTFQITVEAVDDLPEITLNPQPLVFRVSGRKVVAIDSTATIADIDTPNLVFGGAVLQVSGQSEKDKLSVLKQDGISRKGKSVLLGKTVIGSIAGGTKGTALTIQLNDAATQTSVQLLLRSIGFNAPRNSLGDRTLHVQISNIQGTDTPPATRQIQVVPLFTR